MKDRAAFDFDSDYGEIYDHIARTVIPGYEQMFQATLAMLRLHAGPRSEILIAGCGTGREIEVFASAEPEWHITGADPSEQMIEVSSRLVSRLKLEDRVSLVHGRVSELPPAASFDAATVLNVMHFLPDDGSKEALMQSVANRVRSGGAVALFDLHGAPGSRAFQVAQDGWVEFMRIRGLAGDALTSFLGRLDAGIVYVPEDRVLEICRSAGLTHQCRYFGGFHYGGWLLARGEP